MEVDVESFNIFRLKFKKQIEDELEKYKKLFENLKNVGEFKILMKKKEGEKKVEYFLLAKNIGYKEVKETFSSLYDEFWIEKIERVEEKHKIRSLIKTNEKQFVYLPN